MARNTLKIPGSGTRWFIMERADGRGFHDGHGASKFQHSHTKFGAPKQLRKVFTRQERHRLKSACRHMGEDESVSQVPGA